MSESISENHSILKLLQRYGAVLSDTDALYPTILNFGNMKTEYDNLINTCGVRPVFDEYVIELSGKDVLDFLHRISTNDILSLSENGIIQTIFTNENARIIDKTSIFKSKSKIYLTGNRVFKNKLLAWLEKFIIMDDVSIKDISSEYSIMDILGPESKGYLKNLTRDNLVLADSEVHCINLENIDIFIFSYGKNAARLIYPVSKAETLLELILNISLPYSGEEAFQLYRINNIIPAAPFEINENFNPYECGLIANVSFTKGCYIGQEVVARLDTYDKIQKSLVNGFFTGHTKTSEDNMLYSESGNVIGNIASTGYCSEDNKTLALAIVKKDYIDSDKKIQLFCTDSKKVEFFLDIKRNY